MSNLLLARVRIGSKVDSWFLFLVLSELILSNPEHTSSVRAFREESY